MSVPDDYQLATGIHHLGFRLHQAEDYGTLLGDVMRLREQLEEVARHDPVIGVEAILDAIDQILAQDARRQQVAPELDA